MASNGAANRKGLPHAIELANEKEESAKKGKRLRDEDDSMMSSPSFTKKPNTNSRGTPMSGGSSMSHSVARSIVRGESKRPPPPPSEPPPQLTEIVKILCLGPESPSRRKCMLDLTQRSASASSTNSTTPIKSSTGSENGNPCALEYFKKDYTFTSASGNEKAVRMQFLHLDGAPAETPPEAWEDTRNKINMALLIIDLQEMLSLWQQGELENHLGEWRNVVHTWTHTKLPINLLLAMPESPSLPPAVFLRLGAAISRACRRVHVNRWFLMGSESDSETSSSSSSVTEGLDSTDAVLQSLAEEALADRDASSKVEDKSKVSSDHETPGKRGQLTLASLFNGISTSPITPSVAKNANQKTIAGTKEAKKDGKTDAVESTLPNRLPGK